MRASRLIGLGVLLLAGAVVLAHRAGSPSLPLPRSLASQAPAAQTFTDAATRFSIAKPAGWWMLTGESLRQRAQDEARRLGDASFAPPTGGPTELLVRFTRYAPGQAPGPNPTIVVTRFDLTRFPPGTSADDLLRLGIASARAETAPTTVELGGRPWQTITASRNLARPDGATVEVLQEVYATAGTGWGLGVVISATRSQHSEYRAAFDAVLASIRFP